jgi:hypothetical protein
LSSILNSMKKLNPTEPTVSLSALPLLYYIYPICQAFYLTIFALFISYASHIL